MRHRVPRDGLHILLVPCFLSFRSVSDVRYRVKGRDSDSGGHILPSQTDPDQMDGTDGFLGRFGTLPKT